MHCMILHVTGMDLIKRLKARSFGTSKSIAKSVVARQACASSHRFIHGHDKPQDKESFYANTELISLKANVSGPRGKTWDLNEAQWIGQARWFNSVARTEKYIPGRLPGCCCHDDFVTCHVTNDSTSCLKGTEKSTKKKINSENWHVINISEWEIQDRITALLFSFWDFCHHDSKITDIIIKITVTLIWTRCQVAVISIVGSRNSGRIMSSFNS